MRGVSGVDYAIIFAFIAYVIVQGLRSRRVASKSLNEYFLAGRTLKGWHAGISLAATQFAADTPLLVTGLIATAGVFSLWRLWIYAVSFLLIGIVLGMSWRRAGVLTDAELTEVRYRSPAAPWLRGAKVLYYGTVFNCIVLAMVLYATMYIAEPFLLWDQWLPHSVFQPVLDLVERTGIVFTIDDGSGGAAKSASNLISVIILVTVTTFYSTTGGLRSVVATDILQFALMMLATLGFAYVVVVEVGGLGAMADGIRERFAHSGPAGMTPDQILAFTPSQAKDVGFALLAVFGLQWLLQISPDGTGYIAQRMMACRSDNDARQAAVVFTVAQVFFRSVLWLPIGIGLLLIIPPDLTAGVEVFKQQREASFVTGMSQLLPVGLKGLMVTAMLAALASTIDTHLNLVSSYWTNDIYKRFVCQSWRKRQPSGRELVWVARSTNVLALILSLVVMTQLGSIQGAWKLTLLFGAGVGIPMVLRWLWWRLNAWGELSCLLASLVVAPFLLHHMPSGDQEYVRLLVVAALATLVAVVVSLLTSPEPMETLVLFYKKAQPPGAWGPVVEAAGLESHRGMRRLAKALAAVALSSVSIFCLLTAVGSVVAGSPAPTWFPLRNLWLASLFVIGAGLIPWWWRLAGLSAKGRVSGALVMEPDRN